MEDTAKQSVVPEPDPTNQAKRAGEVTSQCPAAAGTVVAGTFPTPMEEDTKYHVLRAEPVGASPRSLQLFASAGFARSSFYEEMEEEVETRTQAAHPRPEAETSNEGMSQEQFEEAYWALYVDLGPGPAARFASVTERDIPAGTSKGGGKGGKGEGQGKGGVGKKKKKAAPRQ